MKYKVIAEILDGTICATKNRITCFNYKYLINKDGDRIDPQIGEILPTYSTKNAEYYWSYSRKEWEYMNREFNKI